MAKNTEKVGLQHSYALYYPMRPWFVNGSEEPQLTLVGYDNNNIMNVVMRITFIYRTYFFNGRK